jgi:hypothetical protein
MRAVLAVAVLAALAVWAGPAHAQAPNGTKLTLRSPIPFVPGTGAGSEAFVMQLDIAGAPADTPLFVSVERYDDVSNNANPRDQLTGWLRGRRGEPSTVQRVRVPVPGDRNVRFPLSRDPGLRSPPRDGFNIVDAGVFPLLVTLETEDSRSLAQMRTFLIRLPVNAQSEPPLLVAPIVGVRAPVALQPDRTRPLANVDRERIARTQRLLADHPNAPLTIDPLPETVAALSTGPVTPETLRNAIDDRVVLASSFVEVEPERWLASGLRDQLERQRHLAVDGINNLLPARRVDAATWVARPERPVGPTARAELQTFGPEPVSRLVLPSSTVSRVSSTDADLQPFDVTHDGGAMRAVLADELLASRLTTTGDPVLDAQATLADLAVLACGSNTRTQHCNTLPRTARGVALVVPDDVKALDAFDRVLRVTSTPNVQVELAELQRIHALSPATGRGNVPLVRSHDAGEPPAGLGDIPSRLTNASTRVRSYRSMLIPPAPEELADPSVPLIVDAEDRPTDRADRLSQLLDVAIAANPTTRSEAYIQTVTAELDRVLGAVQTPTPEPITLTSEDGIIEVRITNQLDHPLTLQVQLTSDKPLFTGANPEVEASRSRTVLHQVPPEASSTVKVPVKSVAAGSTRLDVRVRTPDGALQLASTSVDVRSTVVSAVGVVLTVAAGVFLLIWWGRHFRDARRARKLVDADEVEEAVRLATGEFPVVR